MAGKKTTKPLVPLCGYDRVLALDMSLAHTGYALADLASGAISKGLIEPKGRAGARRLAFLRDQVLGLAHPTTKLLVLIEGYAFGARGAAVVSLGELGGVIRVALHDHDVPYIEVPPMRVKKFVTGKGNAKKDVMLMEILDRWGEKHHDDNVADAFALLQLGLALLGTPSKPLLKFQQDVVNDILGPTQAQAA